MMGKRKVFNCKDCSRPVTGRNDLWTFRDRVVLSRPMIGLFTTQYFLHLSDPSRLATSVIFAVCCQLTVNYSLTTSCIKLFLLISISQFYFRAFKVLLDDLICSSFKESK